MEQEIKRKILFFLLLIINAVALSGQDKITVSGFIYDSFTGEILIGATVYDQELKTGVSSNEYGFYSMSIPNRDSIKLKVSYVGYKPLVILIKDGLKTQYDFRLEPGVAIDEVTVSVPRENNIVRRNETGVTYLDMKEIKTLPNLFGEVDIIKPFQLSPGVQSGGEAKSNLHVRGGSPDQNLILLDDVPLYYVAHFGGFFSVFNADAINDVKLTKGGFPARYGSRLSSVLDVRMKEGSMQNLMVQGTVGLLSSKIAVEGPVIPDKSSFIVSARKNVLPFFKLMGTNLSYNFYDLNAKLNYRLSGRNKMFLSFYMGDDILTIKDKNYLSKRTTGVKWGNTLVSLRWNSIISDKLFGNFTVSNTSYRYKNIARYNFKSDTISKNLENTLLTGINDLILNTGFSYLLTPAVGLKFGTSSIRHKFIPNDEFYYLSVTNDRTINETYTSSETALENAVYLENEIKLKILSGNLGARFSSYLIEGRHFYSLEPRLIFNLLLLEDLSLKYSFSKMNQYVHLLSYSGTGIPSDYWLPANENAGPEHSIQHSLGLAKSLFKSNYELSIEAYHKTLSNLITFIPGESLMGSLGKWEDIVEKGGTGLNYGIELFLQKRTGETTGWIGATLAKAERTFENINNGEPYAFKYDRLLDLSIVANHRLNEKFTASIAWTYGSGYPVTLAFERYNINGDEILIYGDKNSFRMNDFHRLDIAFNFFKKTTWGERTWSVSVFNLYNRQNPYYYYYDRKLLGSKIDMSGGGYSFIPEYDTLKLYQRSLFSIFPSVSYSFKFQK